MRETEVPVTFQSPEKTVYVLRGTKLLEAAALADLVLKSPCGGEGLCGKCRVVVPPARGEPTAAERQFFSAEELHSGCRLACQCTVDGPMSVVVPQPSLLGARGQILVHSEGTVAAEVDPVVRKRYVELPLPARGDDDADLARLEKAVGPLEIDLELLRGLPRRLRESGFRGTAVLADGRLLDFEPGNTEWNACAVAVDVGTTTLAAALLDANSGRDLAVAVRLNPQTRFGDDVLSRILRTRTDADGLRQLHAAITAAVDEMIGELCRAADVPREQVYEITVAGNTTMQQLFCGLDPGALGEVPFVPVAGRSLLGHRGRAGAARPSPRPRLGPAGDRRLRRRRHGGRRAGHRAGGGPAAHALRRHRHQRRDRAAFPRGDCPPPRPPPARPSRAPGSCTACAARPGPSKRCSWWTAGCGSTSSATCRRPGCAARP